MSPPQSRPRQIIQMERQREEGEAVRGGRQAGATTWDGFEIEEGDIEQIGKNEIKIAQFTFLFHHPQEMMILIRRGREKGFATGKW